MCCLGQCFKSRVPWMIRVPRNEIKCSAIPALYVKAFFSQIICCVTVVCVGMMFVHYFLTALLFRVIFFHIVFFFSNSAFRSVLSS